ncbi:MAG: hypothetical protein ABR987_18760, partial [Terracidiphilus sp.]|jgi:hypothetical protein
MKYENLSAGTVSSIDPIHFQFQAGLMTTGYGGGPVLAENGEVVGLINGRSPNSSLFGASAIRSDVALSYLRSLHVPLP